MGADFFNDDPIDRSENKSSDKKEEFLDHKMEEKHDFFQEKEDSKPEEMVENKSEEQVTKEVSEDKEDSQEKSLEVKEDDSKEVREAKEQIKELIGFIEDQEYKIPENVKLKQKVDGEDTEVTVRELLNNYSGKVAWDKKFSEIDKEKKSFEADLNNVNQYITEFAKKSKEDPVAALEFLAEEIGMDPLQYRKSLRSQLLNKYGEYLQMDEDRRSLFEEREELEYLRRRKETEAKRHAEEQAQRELQRKYSELEQTHGIDSERRSFLEKELKEVYKLDATPENMVQLDLSMKRLDRVDAALEKVNPEFLEDDDKVLALESLLRGNPKMSDKELEESASRLWGQSIKKAVKNLEKYIPKKENKQPSQEFKVRTNSPNNIDFFD